MFKRVCNKTGFFIVKVATASPLMSGDVLVMETIYNFYIRLTKTIMYRIQSSSKKTLNELTYRSQVEENTGYNW